MILTTTSQSIYFDLIEHSIADLPEVTYHRYLCESSEELCMFLEECSRVVAVVSIGPVTGELTVNSCRSHALLRHHIATNAAWRNVTHVVGNILTSVNAVCST